MSKDPPKDIERRAFLGKTAAGAVGMGLSAIAGRAARAQAGQASTAPRGADPAGPYNILFILTDQERYFAPEDYPRDYSLPGRARLQRSGVTFTNHQINTAVCSPSRSVIYTGQHIQHTKMFDNLGFPWTKNMGLETPTLGHMLSEAGYYTAYKGKWHLSADLGTKDEYAIPQEALSAIIARYGFKDYVGIGDVIGETLGGYLNDEMIGAQARRWLRLFGTRNNAEGKPWFLAVNLVNPHDVMFYNTDLPGRQVQDTPRPLMAIAHEPDPPLYNRQWDFDLPATRNEALDMPGRPPAHWEYQAARAALVGDFPSEDGRWRRLLNYYFNCIKQSDEVVEFILDELETLGLRENTIVVLSSDHGELAGSHGSNGKGATAFREQNHVPLIVSHPGIPETHGQECRALTTHLDLAPSMLSWTGMAESELARMTRHLRGNDLTELLAKGAVAGINEQRLGALYCFNMFLYIDSGYMRAVQAHLNAGGDMSEFAELGFEPDLRKRGAIRSVFDGRYKFARYFSPRSHNQPKTLEGLFELNDVELFDLQSDPSEAVNLATDRSRFGDLLLAMNAKLNALIEDEVGERDDGSFLPKGDIDWAARRFDP